MTTSSTAFAPDAGKSPGQLYAERSQRLLDATELKQPDRVPIVVRFGYMLAELEKTTRLDLYENPRKAADALVKAALRFQPDTAGGLFGTPGPSRALGDRMSRWPGYGLDENGSFQFVEREYMKVEDYDDLIADPTDWTLRVYLPRTFSELEGLAQMQPLGLALAGYWGLVFGLSVFNTPPLARALRALGEATRLQGEWVEQQIALAARMAAAGFPPFNLSDCVLQAPFDYLSDALRGMRGIFSDMHRCPDKLMAAGDQMARLQLQHAYRVARNAPPGKKIYSFTATHRGSDEFISLPQFERFYWAQYKDMLLKAIDAGITPYVFWEGTWNKRLKYLAELPKGKTIGYFHRTDLFKAKEVLGDTMCIMGGMPVSLLAGGTVQEIREHTKRLCEIVGKGGGFIMTTSTGELEGCNPDLVQAWVDATKEFGTY
jgi:uroporphyrinogen-III decarboxylase